MHTFRLQMWSRRLEIWTTVLDSSRLEDMNSAMHTIAYEYPGSIWRITGEDEYGNDLGVLGYLDTN